jgi:hypothetical protein
VLAACALPGVVGLAAPRPARADEAPEKATIEFKLSGYNEWQNDSSHSSSSASGSSVTSGGIATISAASGGGSTGGTTGGSTGTTTSSTSSSGRATVGRAKVISPAIAVRLPLGREWALEGAGTVDRVSGASPTYYADQSSFANFEDTRRAIDGKLTRYFRRQSLTVGGARSTEADYRSRTLSAEGRWATEDQNTTFNVGRGWTRDVVNPSTQVVVDARKAVDDWQVGVTQAFTRDDLVQLAYTRIQQQGYLNDPYKDWDSRPGTRLAHVVQLRWNHWLGDSALKWGYRWWHDDWGVRAHTVELAWALPVSDGTTFTPELRWHTQSAARFYVPVDTSSATYPQPADTSGYTTLDQRLSAFGAITAGAKLEWPVSDSWSANVKASYYRQDSRLRLLGTGSSGIEPLSAVIWQVGAKHSF